MASVRLKSTEAAEAREADDYNVRKYAYHLYFGYTVALLTLMAGMNFFSPGSLVGEETLSTSGAYFARQSAATLLVMALVTLYGWTTRSGPVMDLVLKSHFAHHLFTMLVDWYSEHHGFVIKQWQQGMFAPHPFFTFLILFLWMTDKSRDLEAEAKESTGRKQL